MAKTHGFIKPFLSYWGNLSIEDIHDDHIRSFRQGRFWQQCFSVNPICFFFDLFCEEPYSRSHKTGCRTNGGSRGAPVTSTHWTGLKPPRLVTSNCPKESVAISRVQLVRWSR